MSRGFVLRSASDDDAPLLRKIFADSHCAGWELLPLDDAGYLQLVEIQLAARQWQYRSAYPGTCEQIIESAGIAVGSCWLAETAEELRVVDIAVLAQHRRNGVARTVLRQVGAVAASRGKPVRLSVWQENTVAQALYRELGFHPRAAEQEPAGAPTGHLELEWVPGMREAAMHTAAND